MNKQDRNGVRTAADLERKYDLALTGMKKAVKLSEEGINKINAELEEFMSTALGNMEELQVEVDGKIATYFYSGSPSLENPPANEWKEEDYEKHVGDMYYDEDTGKSYRFSQQDDDFVWVSITDSEVTEALEAASKAQDTADGKRRVFTVQPFPPYDVGDLWLNDEELYVCQNAKSEGAFASSDFKIATKYTDDTALKNFMSGEYSDDLELINSQIDKKAETWYQSTDPATGWNNETKALHVGDLWYNTTDKKNYIYTSGYTWEEVDGVPDSVYDQIDGKAQIFTSQPVPPYHVGDLYVQGASGDILTCKTERLTGSYNAADWEKASKYTDDAALNQFVNVVYKEAMENLTNQIDSKITTWYYSGVPTLSNLPASGWTTNDEKLKHTGDLYYDRGSGKAYIFELENNVYVWKLVEDSGIAEALALANAASDTADSKRRVFVNQPYPPYDNGDLWFKDQEIYICQITKAEGETYADKDFIIATKYTDDTVANQVGDNLEIVRGTVTTIMESVDAFKIEIETTVKSVNNLQEETVESLERMSYTFGTNDLTIANSNDPVNTRINQQGLKVFTYNTLQSIFNHKGTGIQKLIVVGDAQLGNLSIVKTTDENGVACTDINYLVSNYQTLADLE